MNLREIARHCAEKWLGEGGEINDAEEFLAFMAGLPKTCWAQVPQDTTAEPVPESDYCPYDFRSFPSAKETGLFAVGSHLYIVCDNGMPPYGCLVHFRFDI